MRGCIYRAWLISDGLKGRSYVGQTVDFEKRKKTHFHERYRNDKFHKAILEYGWEAFDWEILVDDVLEEDLNDLEKYYIGLYDCVDNGFNTDVRGYVKSRNDHFTQETRDKLGAVHKGKTLSDEHKDKLKKNHVGMTGKKHSKDTIDKISKSNKGKKRSKETCERIGESKKGQVAWNKGQSGEFHHTQEAKDKISKATTGENNGFYGRHHSDESLNKIRAARKGKKLVIGEDGKRHFQ